MSPITQYFLRAMWLAGKLGYQYPERFQTEPVFATPTRDIQVTPQESEQVSSRLCAD